MVRHCREGRRATGSGRSDDERSWCIASGGVFPDPSRLRAALLPPTASHLAEAFVAGGWDVEGDLVAATRLGDLLARARPTAAESAALARALLRLRGRPLPRPGTGRREATLAGARHSPERDRDAIRYHYDVGNDFFALWLDRRMVYSCAYFRVPPESPAQALDEAQEAKLDLICRKLRLAPGQRFLDIGCGWGALVEWAAEHHGATAIGITNSARMEALGAERIAAAGLGGRARILQLDYREVGRLAAEEGPYDAVASIGMFEHVGRARMLEYFGSAYGALRPGGLFLNHGIGRLLPARDGAGGAAASSRVTEALGRLAGHEFIDRYVFPDGELLPIWETLLFAELAGFEVRDVESLREHYALTLRAWVARLEARRDEAIAATDLRTYRTWRLFMSAAAGGFESGAFGVYQALLARRDGRGAVELPLTREDVYR